MLKKTSNYCWTGQLIIVGMHIIIVKIQIIIVKMQIIIVKTQLINVERQLIIAERQLIIVEWSEKGQRKCIGSAMDPDIYG